MAWLVLGAIVAFSAPACRSFNAFCVERIDCEDGNDSDIEACEVGGELGADQASILGCSSEYNALVDCAELESSCEDAGPDNKIYTFEDNCELEVTEYTYCVSNGTLN